MTEKRRLWLSPIQTGLLVGIACILIGVVTLWPDAHGRTLVSGVCFVVGGGIFLGYSLFLMFYFRARR